MSTFMTWPFSCSPHHFNCCQTWPSLSLHILGQRSLFHYLSSHSSDASIVFPIRQSLNQLPAVCPIGLKFDLFFFSTYKFLLSPFPTEATCPSLPHGYNVGKIWFLCVFMEHSPYLCESTMNCTCQSHQAPSYRNCLYDEILFPYKASEF